MARDSRVEAMKAKNGWRQIKRVFAKGPYLFFYEQNQRRRVEAILEALARREYEAGYQDGMQDRVNAQTAEEGRKARRRG